MDSSAISVTSLESLILKSSPKSLTVRSSYMYLIMQPSRKLTFSAILFTSLIASSISQRITTQKPETTTEDTSKKLLVLPEADKCVNRPKHFELDGHWYFYSGDTEEHKDDKVNWLISRNRCRQYCMDLISLESPTEHDLISDFIVEKELPYIWTSGRKCNFKGCEREDLQPVNVYGWFWSGSGVKMAPTNSTPPGWDFQPWSFTGHKTSFAGKNIPQPDNAEYEINQSDEACMGFLNDIYNDGVTWHDIACYHKKSYICEDSPSLLEFVRKSNPKLVID
ncbi:uncharacterized protein slf isoform X1 [Lepeophtheirus salmonis]|uniref:uncharacterized protein slf isoform X1 n=1 Tax=Lepeophtheirus salmonis TaxID=72036 RepID=UPI001AE8D8A5|nr:uncharacterized protein LOC121115790 isoform X1 [Lepeophtheirus salmonis]